MRCVEINLVLVLVMIISIIQIADCWNEWYGRGYGDGWDQWDYQDMYIPPPQPYGFRHDTAWYTQPAWINPSPYVQHGQWPMRNWNTQDVRTHAAMVQNRLIIGDQIPMLPNNPFIQTKVIPFGTSRPTFDPIASVPTEQQSVTIKALTSTVRPKLIPQLRFGNDVPRDTASVDWEDYENEMKEKYDDKSDDKSDYK